MISIIDVRNNKVPDNIYIKMKEDSLRDVEKFRQFPARKLTAGQLYSVCFAAGVPVKEVIKPGGLGNIQIMLQPASVTDGEDHKFIVQWYKNDDPEKGELVKVEV